jgi:hypothetical protein
MTDLYTDGKFQRSFYNDDNNKRMAVCLYGQYRIGDYLLPWIKHVYDLSEFNIHVDFFVSIKEFNSYNPYTRFDIKDINDLYEFDVEDAKRSIYNILPNVRKFNIIPRDMDYIAIQGNTPVSTGIFDSIMLKQEYELENNIEYDFVFMQRFDSQFLRLDLPKRIVEFLNTLTLVDYRAITTSTNFNFIMATIFIPKTQELESPFRQIQDLVMCGTSTAWDNVAAELPNSFSSNKPELRHKDIYHRPCVHRVNAHSTLYEVMESARVEIIPLTTIYTRGKKQKSHPIIHNVIRETFDLTLDPFDEDTFYHFRDLWMRRVIK